MTTDELLETAHCMGAHEAIREALPLLKAERLVTFQHEDDIQGMIHRAACAVDAVSAEIAIAMNSTTMARTIRSWKADTHD